MYITVFNLVLCWLTISITINTADLFFSLHTLFYFRHLSIIVVDITEIPEEGTVSYHSIMKFPYFSVAFFLPLIPHIYPFIKWKLLCCGQEKHKLHTSYPCPIQQKYSIILQNTKFSRRFPFPQLDTNESTNWYKTRTYQSLLCTHNLHIELLFSFNITSKCLLIILLTN